MTLLGLVGYILAMDHKVDEPLQAALRAMQDHDLRHLISQALYEQRQRLGHTVVKCRERAECSLPGTVFSPYRKIAVESVVEKK